MTVRLLWAGLARFGVLAPAPGLDHEKEPGHSRVGQTWDELQAIARSCSLVRRLADGVGVSAGVAASPAGVPYTSSSHNE